MLRLYSLSVLIYLLLHAYIDFCVSLCFWLITSHKSIPDLGIDPSRAMAKLSRVTLGIPSRHPSFLFGGLKGLEGSVAFVFSIAFTPDERIFYTLSNVIKGKGKVIPLQARCGPEGG
jgi:hypothetical protein